MALVPIGDNCPSDSDGYSSCSSESEESSKEEYNIQTPYPLVNKINKNLIEEMV